MAGGARETPAFQPLAGATYSLTRVARSACETIGCTTACRMMGEQVVLHRCRLAWMARLLRLERHVALRAGEAFGGVHHLNPWELGGRGGEGCVIDCIGMRWNEQKGLRVGVVK